MQTYRSIHQFKPEGPGEIALEIGEVVQSNGVAREGWIKVSKTASKIEGYVPFAFLEQVAPSAPAGLARPARAAPGTTTTPAAATRQASTAGGEHVSIEHAECAICCEPLHSLPVSVFISAPPANKRVCRHFLHLACGNSLVRSGSMQCPICRAPFRNLVTMPDPLKEPQKWFDLVDLDGNKTLSKMEVLEVFKALLPIDWRRLEREVDTLWPRWDQDRSGELDYKEICDPRTGMLVYVRDHFKPVAAGAHRVPVLTLASKKEWFSFYDEDKSGALSQDEVTRALVKTFLPSASANLEKLREMRMTVESIWGLFDTDGSGEIDIGEFCQRDGLGDTIIASLAI